MSLTNILATYAPILACIGIGWNLYRESHDRARVKISVSLMRVATGADGRRFVVAPHLPDEMANANVHVVVKITNAGRRPVLLQGWGESGKFPKGKGQVRRPFLEVYQGMLKGHELARKVRPTFPWSAPISKFSSSRIHPEKTGTYQQGTSGNCGTSQ